MASGIYQIVNTENGKCYVGSSKSIRDRWWEHKKFLKENKHASKRLQNSWNKYGEETFSFVILEIVENFNELLIREQYWIDYYQSYLEGKGFNIRRKAESNLGMVHTQEAKDRIRIAVKNRKVSPETKKKLSEIAHNQWSDPKRRESVSKKALKQWSNPNTRNKIVFGIREGRKRKWGENQEKAVL